MQDDPTGFREHLDQLDRSCSKDSKQILLFKELNLDREENINTDRGSSVGRWEIMEG
jgi:hypothetical protein